MRAAAWILAVAAWIPLLWQSPSLGPKDPTVRLVLIGDTNGYLSPCGCVKPMAGGIRRRLAAIKLIRSQGPTVVVDSGGLVAGVGRQQEIKAETLAEAARSAGVGALGLKAPDAKLGAGLVQAVDRLSGGVVTTLGLREDNALGLRPWIAVGQFLVVSVPTDPSGLAGLLNEPVAPIAQGLRDALAESNSQKLVPIALLDVPLTEAVEFAKEWPEFRLVVARGQSSPLLSPVQVGEAWVLPTVDKANVLITLEWAGSSWKGYRTLSLGPELEDDPEGSRLFKTYTKRVADERLIERLPRADTAEFAGSSACAGCHADEYLAWKNSRHASALRTLETEEQDRDPECTGCHVVGLDSVKGFRDRVTTPELANVGCESCHGPSRAHVLQPSVPTPRNAAESCVSCHNPAHSPGFDYETYWPKIRHGCGKLGE